MAFLTFLACKCLLFHTKQILQQMNSYNKMAVCCDCINPKIILELITAFYFIWLLTMRQSIAIRVVIGEKTWFHPQNKNPHQCIWQTIWAIQVLTRDDLGVRELRCHSRSICIAFKTYLQRNLIRIGGDGRQRHVKCRKPCIGDGVNSSSLCLWLLHLRCQRIWDDKYCINWEGLLLLSKG